MKKIIMLLSLFAMVSTHIMADSKQTVTINGSATGKSATRITFAGDDITLAYSDGTSQTTDMAGTTIAFEHVAVFKASDYDNLATIKTYGGQTLAAEVSTYLAAGQWTTITLPFALTADDIAATFGTGTRVAVLQSVTAEGINFTAVSEMAAGMPYIICPAKTVNTFYLSQATITTMATGATIEGEKGTMTGNLANLGATLSTDGTGTTLKGDVNHDGNISVGDVMAIVEYILKGAVDIDKSAADCNSDGSINVSDVMAVVEIVLSGWIPAATEIITVDGEEINVIFQS